MEAVLKNYVLFIECKTMNFLESIELYETISFQMLQVKKSPVFRIWDEIISVNSVDLPTQNNEHFNNQIIIIDI